VEDGPALAVGDVVELDIGPVAHGGHCVARHEGRVVFVRHALPGERVFARVTEAKPGSFARADAVDVLVPSAGRVAPPCVHFEPGGCGGCDFQHASADLQLTLKATVVAEQLDRLGGIKRRVEMEALPGDGFGWRTRVRWGSDGTVVGPRVYRSAALVPVTTQAPCLIAPPGLTAAARSVTGVVGEVVLTAVDDGSVLVTPPDATPATVVETVFGREFEVAADGFWQVHPGATEALVDAVLEYLPDLTGRRGWDLYGGVGLFAAFLADAGADVDCVEADPVGVEYARRNLSAFTGSTVHAGRVERVIGGLPAPDVVVLDPPRSGAGRAVCEAIAATGPRTVVYVACDPAALGRDTATLRAAGYDLGGLRAFDAFPQTHHVECVARFDRH
jgi:tRNA/tmRNA/rRNA uracil-C5-methylase (TrmA/RlmC/RlmD family)